MQAHEREVRRKKALRTEGHRIRGIPEERNTLVNMETHKKIYEKRNQTVTDRVRCMPEGMGRKTPHLYPLS